MSKTNIFFPSVRKWGEMCQFSAEQFAKFKVQCKLRFGVTVLQIFGTVRKTRDQIDVNLKKKILKARIYCDVPAQNGLGGVGVFLSHW